MYHLCTYPLETANNTGEELIVKTPKPRVRMDKRSSSGGRVPCSNTLPRSYNRTAAIPHNLIPPSTVMQSNNGKSKCRIIPGNKDPPGGTPLSFPKTADARASPKRAMFVGGSRPNAVGDKEDPGRGVGE